MAVPTWLKRTYWTLASFGLLYVLAILALTVPIIQRNAIYAHNVNPTLWQNLSNVDQFGFLRHQVQPFTVTTLDNETLYAWHILPVDVYKQHEKILTEQPNPVLEPFEKASARVGFQLLFNNPAAQLVLSFHGNAAHLASAQRPATYRQFLGLSSLDRPVHVIAFDYRGFGLSTGSPTDDGVTLDGLTIASALTGYGSSSSIVDQTNSAETTLAYSKGIDPSRITLVGQSLGTFVSTSLYHDWTIRLQRPAFRGLVLLASFTSLTKLLDSYSIKGITPPLLSPLMGYPQAQAWVMSKIADKWETQRRLVALFQHPSVLLDLIIMHARDDWEIPWTEGRGNWDAIMGAVGARERSDLAIESGVESLDLQSWHDVDKRRKVRWERILHGGHNKVAAGEHAKLAVLRILDGA